MIPRYFWEMHVNKLSFAFIVIQIRSLFRLLLGHIVNISNRVRPYKLVPTRT